MVYTAGGCGNLINVSMTKGTKTAKVLIVEDDVQLAFSVKEWLAGEGHTISMLHDGKDALDWLAAHNCDVIVLDLLLPHVNGTELCRHYRKNGGTAKILVLTSRDHIDDMESLLDSGADDYVTKPFDLKEVSARIRSLMRRSTSSQGSQLIAEDVVLDPMTHRVHRAGREIDLLPQEFALLEFFMRQPERIFSTELIIKTLWRGNASVDTVRTHIKTLRRKLNKPGLKPFIRTVHGVGYSLTGEDE
jgi:DNA-binding response OmpR family regulator